VHTEKGKGGKKAWYYVRTSTQTNKDKSGPARAKAAIKRCATARAVKLIGGISEIVSGSLPACSRKGFRDLLAKCKASKVKELLVENARAVARDALVNEALYNEAKNAGVEIIAADFPGLYRHNAGPLDKFLRRLVFMIQELEKDSLVERLANGRGEKQLRLEEQLRKYTERGARSSPGSRGARRARGPRIAKPLLTRKGAVKVVGRKTLFAKLAVVTPAAKARVLRVCRSHLSVRELAAALLQMLPWGRRDNPMRPQRLSTSQTLRLRDQIKKEWR